MAFRLPRLPQNAQITTANGLPTLEFQRWWQSVVTSLETQEALQDAIIASVQAIQLDIIAVQAVQQDTLDALVAAQAAATAAQDAADTAIAAATSAQTAADDANGTLITVNGKLIEYEERITALEP